MHSCDITILLDKLYFTTSNNLTKNLSVASVSSFSISSLKILKKAKKFGKNVNFGSDTHIWDAKMSPFNTFGLDVFTYLKHIGVQIKEKITGKTASVFFFFFTFFGAKYRSEKAS